VEAYFRAGSGACLARAAKTREVKRSQAKPSQYINWGDETCAKRKSTNSCLLDITAFEGVVGLYDRHLNSIGVIRLLNNFEVRLRALISLAKEYRL